MLPVEMSMIESDSPTMAAPVAEQVELELAEASQPLHVIRKQALVGLEQAQVSLNNGGKAKKPLSFYMTFLALNICVLIVSLDATALSVAVTVITHDLTGTTLEAFWASLCFLLAVLAVMPIIMSLSDVLGRKIPLYASFIIFITGSIVFAVANSMGILILGRVMQGLGGGGLDVLGEVILVDITTLKERPLYLGLFSIPMAGGAICGPVVGAALAENASWRWTSWILSIQIHPIKVRYSRS